MHDAMLILFDLTCSRTQ